MSLATIPADRPTADGRRQPRCQSDGAGLTVILGMNNPYGPGNALVPDPERCTGWRLWKMLDEAAPDGMSRARYLDGFDRRNVIEGRRWDRRTASAVGWDLRAKLSGRRVVICGAQTLAALGLARPPAWCAWTHRLDERLDYCLIPHPSGLCRAYNDAATREAVKTLLWREYLRGQGT